MKIRLNVKSLFIIKCRYWCGLQQGEKYCLIFVFEQVESQKAHKTLRSAESIPTLSAACKPNLPFSTWRRVFIYLSIKAIIFYLLTKVDGQMSRSSRDKCPVHTESIPFIKIEDSVTSFLLGKICRLPLFASCCRYSTDSILYN